MAPRAAASPPSTKPPSARTGRCTRSSSPPAPIPRSPPKTAPSRPSDPPPLSHRCLPPGRHNGAKARSGSGEGGQHLAAVEVEEALLVGTDLRDVDLVEP